MQGKKKYSLCGFLWHRWLPPLHWSHLHCALKVHLHKHSIIASVIYLCMPLYMYTKLLPIKLSYSCSQKGVWLLVSFSKKELLAMTQYYLLHWNMSAHVYGGTFLQHSDFRNGCAVFSALLKACHWSLELPWDQPSKKYKEYLDWIDGKAHRTPWSKMDTQSLGVCISLLFVAVSFGILFLLS